jgi:protein-tyrosine phosphatase
MLQWLCDAKGAGLRVTTAGTHALDGQPIGARTRAALDTVAELSGAAHGRHRSRQLVAGDVERADLVVAMEADHVRFVRSRHPRAAARTATLRRLCRELPPGPAPLADRVAELHLEAAVLGSDEDVDDPAGGDDEAYAACAGELWTLCRELVERI